MKDEPILAIRHLTAGYGGQPVITDISLEVHQGEIVSIIGPNSSGKSTLFKAISGVLPQVEGQIVFQGVDIGKMEAYRRARLGIVHVPQENMLFGDMTVMEHLQLAMSCCGKWLCINDLIERANTIFPWFRQVQWRKVSKLSGGEQKAVALIRGLAGNTVLLLLDEPTAGLDKNTTERLAQFLVNEYRNDNCILLIEQHLDFARKTGDYIIQFKQVS